MGRIRLSFVTLLAIWLSNLGAAVPDLDRNSKTALTEFYTALEGESWNNNTGWDGLLDNSTYRSPCASSWHGLRVNCTNSQAVVIGLDFERNNLNGSFDIAVRNFATTVQNLSTIELKTMRTLSGTIPPSLLCGPESMQTSLGEFILQGNNISGTLPSNECLSRRSGKANLTIFDVGDNAISGILPSAFLCDSEAAEKLVWLNISRNQISGVLPTEECLSTRRSVSKLSLLDISGNDDIDGTLPEALYCGNDAAKPLTFFASTNTSLSGTLPSDACLASRSADFMLHTFRAQGSSISGMIPHSLMCGSAGSRLNELQVSDMGALSGTLPACNTDIGYLAFKKTQLSGTLPEMLLCGNNSLRFFRADDTHISGMLPGEECWIQPRDDFKQLTFSRTSVSGTIPRSLMCTNSTIEFLDFHGTMVSGTIPTCSDDNPGNAFLTTFDIRESRVSGHIPDLRRFQGLQVLSMSSLDLHGTLNELPSNMAYLSIQGTQVAGNLDGLAKLPLRKVLAAGNKLDGSIPHELFDSDIEQVQLSQNMIRGSIPTEINRATNLTYLVLTDNSINGELPGELSNILSNLNKIQLDLNQISCDLKPSLRDWSAVKATVRVLNGNIFGCTGLESLQEKDENGDSYVCPEDAYIVPLVMAVMAVATVLAALCCSCRYACMRDEPRAFLYWCKAEDANIVQRTSANTWKLGIMVAIMSALIVAVGVPTYVYADSSVTCQYFDTYSIAFLSAFENDFKAMHSPTGWIILFLLVACMAATVGFVKRSHDVVIQKFSENKARTSGMQGTALSMQSPADGKGEGKEDRGRTCCDIFKLIVVIVLVCVLLVIVQAVSSVFQVIIDISTAIPESWKLFLAFLLAGFQTFSSVVIVPEGVENLGVFVSKLLEASHDHTSASVLVKGRDLAWRAMTMGLATASFEVIGSIFAPLLAQLFIDSSCLRPLFEGKETYESTSLSTNVCGVYEGNWVYDSQGVYRQSWFCSRLLTVDSGEYTPNFRFRRDYCASRVVSTFTPFFIASVIFIAAMPLINLFLPWCFRRPPSCSKISFCGCCTLDVFKENLITIWPDSTNDFSDDEIAEMTNMLLIKDRNLVLILLGTMLTMGIAAPIVAGATGIVAIVLGILQVYHTRRLNSALEYHPQVLELLRIDASVSCASTLVWLISAMVFWAIFGFAYNVGWIIGAIGIAVIILLLVQLVLVGRRLSKIHEERWDDPTFLGEQMGSGKNKSRRAPSSLSSPVGASVRGTQTLRGLEEVKTAELTHMPSGIPSRPRSVMATRVPKPIRKYKIMVKDSSVK